MNTFKLLLPLCGAIFTTGCGQPDQAGEQDEVPVQTEEQAGTVPDCGQPDQHGVIEIQPGLTAKVTRSGYGRAAASRDYADVHTTLWLYDEAAERGRGTEIWSSGGTDPFQFQLDAGQVIEGWDLGVRCMLVGETRELTIAPELGYGVQGKPPVPPNATLLFEIELVELKSPE